VIVDNFNPVRAILAPDKAHPPLVIHADTVLPFAVSLQGFKLVPRRYPQAGKIGGRLKLQQLTPRHAFDVFEPGNRLAMEERLSVRAVERMDHDRYYSVTRYPSSGNISRRMGIVRLGYVKAKAEMAFAGKSVTENFSGTVYGIGVKHAFSRNVAAVLEYQSVVFSGKTIEGTNYKPTSNGVMMGVQVGF